MHFLFMIFSTYNGFVGMWPHHKSRSICTTYQSGTSSRILLELDVICFINPHISPANNCCLKDVEFPWWSYWLKGCSVSGFASSVLWEERKIGEFCVVIFTCPVNAHSQVEYSSLPNPRSGWKPLTEVATWIPQKWTLTMAFHGLWEIGLNSGSLLNHKSHQCRQAFVHRLASAWSRAYT